jgi:CheY-like chemotaxis protein
MSEPSRTVLIVDDDPQILRLVEKMLRHKKFEILVAPRPSQALEICRNGRVHLLISDIAMPEMNGEKLAERVRELQPDVPILLISGHYKEEPEAAAAGRAKFLSKPFFPADLMAALRELLPDL